MPDLKESIAKQSGSGLPYARHLDAILRSLKPLVLKAERASH